MDHDGTVYNADIQNCNICNGKSMNEPQNIFYESALKRSAFFKWLMAVVFVIMFVAPIALVTLFFLVSSDLAEQNAEAVGLLKIVIVIIAVVGILMAVAVMVTLFRQMSSSLVASDRGLLYKGILGNVDIRWKEIESISEFKAGRRPPSVKLHMKDGKEYAMDPFLVEKGPNAPGVSFSWSGEPTWIDSDGEKRPITFTGSAGYHAVKSFRPRLIEKLRNSDDYNLTV